MDLKQLAETLKAKGVRPTQQRLLVYRYLMEHPIHATADTVYEALVPDNPSFSKTTVYNTIRVLTESGLLHPVTIDGGFIRYDANVSDHGHFKCNACGQIFDFPLRETQNDFEELKGFKIYYRDFYLSGCCPSCQNKK